MPDRVVAGIWLNEDGWDFVGPVMRRLSDIAWRMPQPTSRRADEPTS